MGLELHAAFLVDGERMNPDIGQNIVDGDHFRTMDGASTLTLVIHDPDGDLWETGALTRTRRTRSRPGLREAAQDRLGRTTLVYGPGVGIDRHAFRLSGMSRQGSLVTMNWKDEVFAALERHRKPRSAVRGEYSRGQFIRSMIREERTIAIPTFMPGERLARSPRADNAPNPGRPERGLTVDSFEWGLLGRKPTKDEIRNLTLGLEAAQEESAGERATLALLEAGIVEAPYWANPTGGHSSSVGVLQLLDIHLGGSTSAKGGRRDVKLVCRLFLTDGFTGAGGAIAVARKHPNWTPGQIAQEVQGSDFPDRYEEHRREAEDILSAWGGASGGPVELPEDYLFWRGSPDWKRADGPKENTVQAATRLAGEVNARFYTANGILVYAHDKHLINRRPQMTVARRAPKSGKPERHVYYVGELNGDWEAGKPVSEVTFEAPAEEFVSYPGAVTEIKRGGPFEGRWLTWSIREKFGPGKAEIVLRRPAPALPEPASTFSPVSTQAPGEDAGRAGSTARARVLEIARASLTKNSGHNYYLAGGTQVATQLANPIAKSPYRSDCSQWVHACYVRAGLPSPGLTTWEIEAKGTRTSRPKPGDLLVMDGHVEMFVGSGKTWGHGSPPIDESTVAYWRPRGAYFVTYSFLDD